MRRFLGASAMLCMTLTACQAGGDFSDPTSQPTNPSPPPTTASSPTGVSPQPPRGTLSLCENPDGFTIGYPEQWHTNSGKVVARCSQFHPEAFEVPRSTDERVAAITAYIDPVAYARAAAPKQRRNAERQEMAIDGRQAVRLEYETAHDPLYPEGTPLTIYMVEVDVMGDRERTLFIDTIGLEGFDYARNQEVLDRMAQTLEVTT